MRAGLTGGIGSGKSEVATLLAGLGAYIVDTDEIAREVVAAGSDGLAEIAREWPEAIRGGVLDRAALADVVFGDTAARERLNALLHPRIRKAALERERPAAPGQLVVHVVPLLFETGYDRLVDASIVVLAPLERRVKRLVERDGADEARVRVRMAAQIDPDEAARRARFIIMNDGDFSQLRERTAAVYEALRR